jgi:hypothetical protein
MGDEQQDTISLAVKAKINAVLAAVRKRDPKCCRIDIYGPKIHWLKDGGLSYDLSYALFAFHPGSSEIAWEARGTDMTHLKYVIEKHIETAGLPDTAGDGKRDEQSPPSGGTATK